MHYAYPGRVAWIMWDSPLVRGIPTKNPLFLGLFRMTPYATAGTAD